MSALGTTDQLRLVAPLGASLFVLSWSAAVSPYTAYGDDWALLPIFLAAIFVLVWHAHLVFSPNAGNRIALVIYGLVHIPLFSYLFMLALMWISKDGL